MPETNLEREHLAKAERDIAEGERRVTRQMILIEKMRHDGRDTVEAGHLLSTLEATLAEWQAHREEILRGLERHNALRSG